MPASLKLFRKTFQFPIVSRILVLCCVINVQDFFPREFAGPFIVMLGFSLMPFGGVKRSYFKLIWPLVMVLVIGFFGMFGHKLTDILRDIVYALIPIALIYTGYWIGGKREMWRLTLTFMVTFGFIEASVYLIKFISNPSLFNGNLHEVRTEASLGSDLIILAIVLGIFQYRMGLSNLFPKILPRFIAIPVLLVSFIFSYSRTMLLVCIILSLSVLGWLSRANYRLICSVLIIVIGYIVIAAVTPENETGTFRSKLLRSISEVWISDYKDAYDIGINWRGYESYRAVDTYLSGDFSQLILGQGFGALVDLDIDIKLGGDKEFRYIPITHNGYAYLLVKVGLLGLLCYALFYMNAIRFAVRNHKMMNSEELFLVRLLLGCILSVISTMFVVGGMAEMHDSELVFLLGFLTRRIGQYRRQRTLLSRHVGGASV